MSRDRFSRLKFKIHDLDQPILKAYPQLLRHKAILESNRLPNFESILKYIIYLYDPETDLNQEFQDIKDRKAEACALAGLPKAVFKEFEERNPVMMGLIHTFITEIYHNRKHREWLTAQEELDYYTKKRWEAIDLKEFTPKQRLDLNNLCDQLNEKIDRLEHEMAGDHEDVKENMVVDRWSSPEKYASPTYKLITQ